MEVPYNKRWGHLTNLLAIFCQSATENVHTVNAWSIPGFMPLAYDSSGRKQS